MKKQPVLTSAVGAYYYLKVIIAMYFKTSGSVEKLPVERSNTLVIVLTSIVTIVIGLAPGTIAEMFKF